jgi:nucleoside-diphosphate-sugar epimerase
VTKGLKGRRICLIGGAGFIGHNLALSLKAQGAEVTVVDGLQVNNILSFSDPSRETALTPLYLRVLNNRLDLLKKNNIPLFVKDARDYHALTVILTEIKPQVIVHLAAVSHAGQANKDPYSTFDHSLRTLENTLDATRDTLEHFIFMSSSMIYGNFPKGHVDEKSPCDPIGIYGALKFSGEKIVNAYKQVFDLPFTIVRPSALYGQRCVSGRVIQKFIEAALSGEEISINGDGSDCLDFTFIQDLIQGLECVIKNEKSHNEIFNLTYGQSRSLSDMVGLLQKDFPDLKVNYLPRDRLMPERGTLSVDKARDLLDYQPAFPLEKGLPEYIKWYREVWDLS